MISAPKWPSLPRVTARSFAGGGLLVLFILLLVFVAKAFFVLFAGVLFAIFLKTCAEAIARRTPIPYRAALALVLALGIASLTACIVFAGPGLSDQVRHLAEDLPRAIERARGRLHVTGLVPSAEALWPEARTVMAGAGGALRGSVEVVAGTVVAGFIGIYGAFNPGAYVSIALDVVPPARRPRAAEIAHETGRRLGRWLVGRAAAMVFIGAATAIGLALLGVPLAFALGVLAGVLAFIEYIGAITSAIPPILLALTKDPMVAVWVVVLFLGIHFVEGYVMTPLIAKTMVRFPPAYTLAGQTLFGAVFGVIGLTFATPACIVATTLVRMLWVEDVLGDRDA